MSEHTKRWTSEETDRLVALWNDGATAEEIAATLSLPSRQAAIGRIDRLRKTGVELRSKSPANRKRRRHSGQPSAPARLTGGGLLPATRQRKPVQATPRPTGKPIPFLALKDSLCKFAVTEASPFLFCGAPVRPGYSWCDHCCGIVFNGFSQPSQVMPARERRQQWSGA